MKLCPVVCRGVLFGSARSVSLSATPRASSSSSCGSFWRLPSWCLCVSVCLSRQLLHNSNLSSSNGSTEDLFRDSIDSCDIDISEKVRTCFGLVHGCLFSAHSGAHAHSCLTLCFIVICSHQVTSLERKVAELENEILLNGDLKSKLKQENTQLVHRSGPSAAIFQPQIYIDLTRGLCSRSQGSRAGGAAEGPGDARRTKSAGGVKTTSRGLQ